eukprot:2643427-Prymnesium_polylepis.1
MVSWQPTSPHSSVPRGDFVTHPDWLNLSRLLALDTHSCGTQGGQLGCVRAVRARRHLALAACCGA